MPTDRTPATGPTARLSRRRLIALSALTAAAVPLVGTARPMRAGAGIDDDEAYQRAFREALAADPNVRHHRKQGQEFLYRPRQLLVAPADVQRVLVRLREYGQPATPVGGFAGVVRLVFAHDADVPAVVTKLRDPRQWPNGSVPQVQPHHVLVGFGNIMGNPGGPPRPAAALPGPDPGRLGEGAGVTVGICDTGIWREADSYHPQWLGGSYLPEPDDEDPVYLHDDVLALQGGHGTFVAGVVRQAAPGVRVDPEQALSPTGVGDEESLAGALQRLGPEVAVVNLSLGCFTHDDLPPLPLVNAIAGLPKRVVVVAAAGNGGSGRPAWPAALDPVLAVAALNRSKNDLEPAPYSGFGGWVNACAVGARASMFVKGRLALPDVAVSQFLGFADWDGTSFATAHVAGRLAACMTEHRLDAQDARLVLLDATPWHPDYGVLVE